MINPGPSLYPCSVCCISVADDQEALECDNCHLWTHRTCCDVGTEEYKHLENLLFFDWICPVCTQCDLSLGECLPSVTHPFPAGSASKLRCTMKSSSIQTAVKCKKSGFQDG